MTTLLDTVARRVVDIVWRVPAKLEAIERTTRQYKQEIPKFESVISVLEQTRERRRRSIPVKFDRRRSDAQNFHMMFGTSLE